MLRDARAFSGFSSNDIAAAKEFYGGTLGLTVREFEGMLDLELAGGQKVIIYPKQDHEAATYTVLNFVVDDIEDTVGRLAAAGVSLERYGDDFAQDERGISRRGDGPPIAWFRDPAGNILAVIETDLGAG
jgi:predicted enzyme related to lactoylglutathione lyase